MAQPVEAKREGSETPGNRALAATRRDFLKFVVAGSTLVVGGSFLPRERVTAQELPDFFDVGDVLILAELPYANNLTLEVTPHNRVRFELPRLDKGQGIATALAMMIAEEMDADYARTDVQLSDARADRPYTLTGYSSTIRTMWNPARIVAAEARARLVTAAAQRWGVDANTLTTSKSLVIAPDGRRANYGELSAEAAGVLIPAVSTTPKPVGSYTLVGTPQTRKNARDIVTGKQQYTLDIDLPGAVHAVVARPPDIKGTVASFDASAASALPGVEGVVQIPTGAGDGLFVGGVEGGIAVAARTFQEAFAARDALVIDWNPGPLASTSDADLRAQLDAAALPLLVPVLPIASSLDATFEYPYMNHAPLEVQTAAARVTGNAAEVWFASQAPLYTAQLVAAALGVPEANVTVHVVPSGGSFGRHLFSEAAVEAALVSQALDKPVKLMWTRNDDMRNGRFRPMAGGTMRASWLGAELLTFEHSVVAAETDFRHGLGEALTAAGFDLASTPLNQSVFEGSVVVPYDFVLKEQHIQEPILPVPTCSWRSIYSGFTTTSNEIFLDEVARAMGVDEVAFRDEHLTDDRARACLAHVAAAANWGAPLPAGHAQGVAVHVEYRSAVAYIVQVDASDPTDPRLTHAWIAADLGVPINPKGAEAQLQGVLIDGWTTMFRAGNHVDNGRIREGSYGDFLWARMNHTPPATEVHIFPASEASPGGCGELGLPPACAACVNAYARATGTVHHRFPILEFV